MEYTFSVGKHTELDRQKVEVFRDGEFVATIYPKPEEGLHIVSKFMGLIRYDETNIVPGVVIGLMPGESKTQVLELPALDMPLFAGYIETILSIMDDPVKAQHEAMTYHLLETGQLSSMENHKTFIFNIVAFMLFDAYLMGAQARLDEDEQKECLLGLHTAMTHFAANSKEKYPTLSEAINPNE